MSQNDSPCPNSVVFQHTCPTPACNFLLVPSSDSPKGTLIGLGEHFVPVHINYWLFSGQPQSVHSWLSCQDLVQSPVTEETGSYGPCSLRKAMGGQNSPWNGVWVNKEPLCLIPKWRIRNWLREFIFSEILETQSSGKCQLILSLPTIWWKKQHDSWKP